ncbi:c-type cytochrome [Zwartia vadi]|uniref:c-type cytochrome n=1 Tax=Zwartia vadi TaxID=3058168 RepID=UPI0025B46EAF|nr:cytochrome c [Zwartia vadi]MDN3986290.1 cytochrome c [Zwartia vadi]
MKKIVTLLIGSALLSPLWMSTASAQFAKPEDAIKYRQAAFVVLASQFGRMQSTVKGQVPYDAAAIKANVEIVKTLSTLPWGAFGAGTQGKSAAKPEVWSDAAGFKTAQAKFESAVVKLSAAADSGDLEKLRAAFGDVGASCKVCHDSYRVKK